MTQDQDKVPDSQIKKEETKNSKILIKIQRILSQPALLFLLIIHSLRDEAIKAIGIGSLKNSASSSLFLQITAKQPENHSAQVILEPLYQMLIDRDQKHQNYGTQLEVYGSNFLLDLIRWLLFKNHQKLFVNFGSSFLQQQASDFFNLINEKAFKIQVINARSPSYMICQVQQFPSLPKPLRQNEMLVEKLQNLMLGSCFIQPSPYSKLQLKQIHSFDSLSPLNDQIKQLIRSKLMKLIDSASSRVQVECKVQINQKLSFNLFLEGSIQDTILLLKNSLEQEYCQLFSLEPISSSSYYTTVNQASFQGSIQLLDFLEKELLLARKLKNDGQQIVDFSHQQPIEFNAYYQGQDFSRLPFSTMNCPGCTQFYFYKQNISDPTIHTVPIKTLDSTKCSKKQLRKCICDFLNTHGGVILFDCETQNTLVYPVGREITEQQKKKFITEILELLKDIHPLPLNSKHIQVSFVPIRPRQTLIKPYEQLKVKYSNGDEYLRGRYVCRIKVDPINDSQSYFIIDQNSVSVKSTSLQKTTSIIQMKEVRKHIKNYFNKQSTKNKALNKLMGERLSHFQHDKCSSPEIGSPITQYCQLLKNQYPSQPKAIMISREQNTDTIREKLSAIGIKCSIKGQNQKKNAEKYYILYTNSDFEQLSQKLRQNQEFITFGQTDILVQIANYLKIQGKILKHMKDKKFLKEIKNANNRLSFDNLKYCSKIDENAYYLHALSKNSMFQLYIGLKELGLKVKFASSPTQSSFTDINMTDEEIKLIDFNLKIMKYFHQKLTKYFRKHHYAQNVLKNQNRFRQFLVLLQEKKLAQFRDKLTQSLLLSHFYTDQIIYGLLQSEQGINFIGKESILQLFCRKLRQLFYSQALPSGYSEKEWKFEKLLQDIRAWEIDIDDLQQPLAQLCKMYRLKRDLIQRIAQILNYFKDNICNQIDLAQSNAIQRNTLNYTIQQQLSKSKEKKEDLSKQMASLLKEQKRGNSGQMLQE